MRPIIPAALLVFAGLALAGCAALGPAPERAPMVSVLENGEHRITSQPWAEDIENARAEGVLTVLNLRTEEEMEASGFDERAAVEAAGLNYVHIGFRQPETLTDDVLDRALATLRDAEKPVLMHCRTSNRAAAIWAAHRALDDGLSFDDAYAEAAGIAAKPEKLALFKNRVAAYVAERSGR